MGFEAVSLEATYPTDVHILYHLKIILSSNAQHLCNPQDHLSCSSYSMNRYINFHILNDTRIN